MKGEVQDINNSDYFKEIPGLGIAILIEAANEK
jgi:hypothetical protein